MGRGLSLYKYSSASGDIQGIILYFSSIAHFIQDRAACIGNGGLLPGRIDYHLDALASGSPLIDKGIAVGEKDDIAIALQGGVFLPECNEPFYFASEGADICGLALGVGTILALILWDI